MCGGDRRRSTQKRMEAFLFSFSQHLYHMEYLNNIHNKDFMRGSKAIAGCFLFCLPFFGKGIFFVILLSLFSFSFCEGCSLSLSFFASD